MAFVRAKKRGAQLYHELVENHRVDGKVKQRVVLYLGPHPTMEDAIDAAQRGVNQLADGLTRLRREADQYRRWSHDYASDEVAKCATLYRPWGYLTKEDCEYEMRQRARIYWDDAVMRERWAAQRAQELETEQLRLSHLKSVYSHYFE